MKHIIRTFLMLAFFMPTGTRAQLFTQNTRAFTTSPVQLGMGGAGVALPKRTSAVFYNPAGLKASLNGHKFRFDLLGVRTGVVANGNDWADFLQNDFQNALDTGWDQLPNEEKEAIYDESLELSREQNGVGVQAGALLPHVAFRLGSHAAMNLGVWSDAKSVFTLTDGGAGVPEVQLLAQADAMGVVGWSMDISPALSVGLKAQYTDRRLVAQKSPMDAFDQDYPIYALHAKGISADVGLLYRLPLVRGLQIGAAVYDVFSDGLDQYSTEDAELVSGQENPTQLAEFVALAKTRKTGLSYRAGLGYSHNFGRALGISLAADYAGYQNPALEQDWKTGVYLGGELRLLRFLQLRGGFHQGYLSYGGGLDLGGLFIDYAYYGTETGRLPGQAPQYTHQLQVVLGLW